MEDDTSSDLQKCLDDGTIDTDEGPMDTDEGPLINENSNGLSHLLTEGEFNSVEAAVDESSTSNQGFSLNAVELSEGIVGDYLQSNAEGFDETSFDVGDNAVTFPNDSMNNVLDDGGSLLCDDTMKTDADVNNQTLSMNHMETDFDVSESEASCPVPTYGSPTTDDNNTTTDFTKTDDEIPTTDPVDADNNVTSSEAGNNVATSNVDNKVATSDAVNTDDIITETAANVPLTDAVNNTTVTDAISSVSSEPENMQEIIKKIKKDKDAIKTEKLAENIEASEAIVKKEKISVKNINMLIKKEEPISKTDDIVYTEKGLIKSEYFKEEKDFEDAGLKSGIKNADADLHVKLEHIAKKEVKESAVKSDAADNGDLDKKKKVGGAEETEVVSEDELPEVQKPSVKDAENVSDDELPGPKPAELPADTEVVSEDELPTAKKDNKETRKRKPDGENDGYDPGSPTSETENSSKKQAVAKNGESKPVPSEKRTSIDEKPKKKVLPELDKYWKVVNDDPTDFTGWTYLLQYVDQESDVEAAREAYDAFLSHYPYCYGYWRKYADYEKRKGSKKKCLEVLEKGLKAIPLSVDLWIHYLNHIKATKPDEHSYIRAQYERAIEACGLEFRSDRLWESYIKWEDENGSALNVTNIYDRLLATPTLGYTGHFDNFQEHVMSEPVGGVISREELVRLRTEVRDAAGTVPQLDLPPGEDEPPDHIASDDEGQAIKERIIAIRRKVHKATGEQVAARWTFEEGIKRPYFHVKPLERCQLKNWKAYLEWEKQHGSLKRALVLHERCLIACALYEEFWMRLIKFLEERAESNPELVAIQRDVFERACTVHHLDKADLHLHWAQFEEAQGNAAKAAEILDRIEKSCSCYVQIQFRRVNLERRRGDYDKCCQLYEGYINAAKNKAVASSLSVKYARFLFHLRRQPEAARIVLDEAIARDPLNHRLHMQRLDLALHTPDTPYSVLEELVQSYEQQEGAEAEVSASMAWRRRELAEELGSAEDARAAYTHARALAKHLRKRARKDKHDPPLPPATTETKKKESTASTTSASVAGNSYYQQPGAATQPYEQSYAPPYQPPWGYQQPGPYQHHPHPWPQYY